MLRSTRSVEDGHMVKWGSTADMPVAVFPYASISSLKSWFEADLAVYTSTARTTLAVADADVVGSWTDQSSNAWHLEQATAGNKPTFQTNQVAGFPAVKCFSGSSQYLLANTPSGISGASPWTYFAVFKLLATTQYGTVLGMGIGSGAGAASMTQAHMQQNTSNNTLFLNTNDGTYNTALNASAHDFTAGFNIGMFCYDGTNFKYYCNNKLLHTRAMTFNLGNEPFSMFSPYDCTGQYGDNLIHAAGYFNAALSDAERASVHKYLSGKTGIALDA